MHSRRKASGMLFVPVSHVRGLPPEAAHRNRIPT